MNKGTNQAAVVWASADHGGDNNKKIKNKVLMMQMKTNELINLTMKKKVTQKQKSKQ